MGRRSKYDPETFPLLAYKYASEGYADSEICKLLGISHQTYYDYQSKFPEFLESIREGKRPANALVEKAALKKALGYEVEEETIEYAGSTQGKKARVKSIKKTKKHIQPSDSAIQFWLRNRDRDRWPDKQQIDVKPIHDVDGEMIKLVSQLTPDDLRKLAYGNEEQNKKPEPTNKKDGTESS